MRPGPKRREGRSTVVDTTELRWFEVGGLPADVSEWFTLGGRAGVTEQRCDSYHLNGRIDVGVKLRAQETLEVKARQSVGVPLMLERGVAGRLEVWRKWSPADQLVDEAAGLRLDVHKTIVKRRFSTDGRHVPDADMTSPPANAGVDVETVAVMIGDVSAWSFAFVAYGPVSSRRPALVACWRSLARISPPPALDLSVSSSCGYPEYLTRAASPWAEGDRGPLHAGSAHTATTSSR